MKKYSTLLLFAVAAILIAAAGTADAAEGLCPVFSISSVEQPEEFAAIKYSVVETTDIKVHIAFPEQFQEEHVISLKFYTPSGHLFRQMDVPVTPDIGREGPAQTRRLPGYPYPVTVAVPEVKRVDGESVPSIEVRFPVGGTSIESSSLFGTWRVNGMVDGVERRCFRPAVFAISE